MLLGGALVAIVIAIAAAGQAFVRADPFAIDLKLAFAAPGVPRGGFIMLTPLFLAIGLPAEGIGLLIAVDAIPDTFASALNSTGFLAATAIVGKC